MARFSISLVALGAFLALLSTTHSAPVPQLQERSPYSGQATYYEPGLGACGGYNSAEDMICAVNSAQYHGSCGKKITISHNGKTVHCKAVDECPDCGYGSLDLSPAVFKKLAPMDQGVAKINWGFY